MDGADGGADFGLGDGEDGIDTGVDVGPVEGAE